MLCSVLTRFKASVLRTENWPDFKNNQYLPHTYIHTYQCVCKARLDVTVQIIKIILKHDLISATCGNESKLNANNKCCKSVS